MRSKKLSGTQENILKRLGKRLVRILNYNARKALNIYISVLMFIGLADIGYTAFLANLERISFRAFLNKNAIETVMLIVALADIVVAYILWMNKEYLLADQRKFQRSIIYLSVLQLIVGNLICVVLGVVTYFTGYELPRLKMKRFYRYQIFFLILLSIVYGFCFLILLKLNF